MLRLLSLALAVLAAGCQARGDGALDFWAMGAEGEAVRRLVPEFERRNPGVRVRVQQVPWSAAHEKLLTAYVGGTPPCAFQIGNTWIPEFAALGALVPLDDRIAASTVVARDDYFAGILDTNVVDGRTWAVPWYVDTRLLFYRSDLFAAAGVDGAAATWAAWRDDLTRVKRASGPDRFALLLPLGEWQTPVILALQRGAGLLRDGDRWGDFQSPEFREAFAFYLDLFTRGLAPRAGDAELGNLYQDFAAGWFAAMITGPWNLGELERRLPPALAESWTTAPLPAPAPPGPGLSLAGGASLALFRGCAQEEQAWRFLEYLSAPAQQLEFHRLSGDLPARRSAWALGNLAADARVAAFARQLEHVRATPKIPEWERIAAKVAQFAEAAIRGETSADAALAALDAEVDAILEKRRWLLAREREAS